MSERILMVGAEDAAPCEQAPPSAPWARRKRRATGIRKRATLSHREAAQALGLLRVLFDAIDSRCGRPDAAKSRELIHEPRLALEDGLDGAVGQVAHPAIDTQRARPLTRRVAKSNALHAPTHDQAPADERRILHGLAVLPPEMGTAERCEAIVRREPVAAAPRALLNSATIRVGEAPWISRFRRFSPRRESFCLKR